MSKLIMQERCIFCKREQYAPAVKSISEGNGACVWCGKTPPKFTTYKAYSKRLNNDTKRSSKHN